MSEKYKFRDSGGLYFVTCTTVGWVDVFTRPELKHIIVSSLRYCQREKGLMIQAWCLMPSHLHMLVSTMGDPLEAILRDFKKFTSKELTGWAEGVFESRREWMLPVFSEKADAVKRGRRYKLWQDGNHPILLTKEKFTRQKMDYIHNNPVAEEFVREADHWLYSSACDYYGTRKGLLEIDFIR
ncbi:MAG: transposase [Cyclobacteriaceae bacterium]|nr:transposase [Cyclobacteriaceae bacterium]